MHQSEWPSSKNLQTINVGEGVDKREHLYTVGGNINWYRHNREEYGGSFKTKSGATLRAHNPTPGHISREKHGS